MKIKCFVFCFVLFSGPVKPENFNNGASLSKSTFTYLDLLTDALKAQQWADDERPCLDTMLRILDNAKNFTLWAVWILDTMQLPVGHLYGQKNQLGNFDGCLYPNRGFLVHSEVPKTQYCLVNITLTETERNLKPVDYVWMEHNVTTDVYLRKPSKHGRVYSSMVWGLCISETCQPSSTSKIARAMLQITHFGGLSVSADFNTTSCQNADSVNELFSNGSNIFLKLIQLLGITTILCTFYVKMIGGTRSFVGEFARSFCLKRNLESLTMIRDEEVHSLNILRIISCYIVVYIHYLLIAHAFYPFDGLQFELVMDNYGDYLGHLDLVVDSFLAFSGLLFTRGILGDRSQNPLKYIWKRYVRLAAALSAVLVYKIYQAKTTSSGPLWGMMLKEHQICADHWLSNMLMTGNLQHANKLCTPPTWYVPCDYQLCIFATILFLIYKMNKYVGYFVFAVAFVASGVIPGIITYVNDYPAVLYEGATAAEEFRNSVFFNNIYIKSYCRAGPFVVGMAMGYLMFTYKPKDYRKTVDKLSSYLALAFCVLIMYATLLTGHIYYTTNMAPLSVAIYVGVNRTIWGIAVCIIIGISEYGDVPALNSIFSWHPLVIISRLTYGVYMIHFLLLEILFFSLRTTFKLDIIIKGMEITGVMVFSLIASLLMWLLVEAPAININNMLADKTWKAKASKSDMNCNGQKKVL